jgi:uncharacterized protein (TIGR03790 family)
LHFEFCILNYVFIRNTPMIRNSLLCAAALVIWGGLATTVRAQSSENVAIVINDNSPESQRVGEYYARARALPPANVLRIRTTTEEVIDRDAYNRTIERALSTAIARERLQDRLLYLVLTKGVPLRITGTAGLDGTSASVDSELTLLYRRMTGQQVPVRGPVDNPFFLRDRDPGQARGFTHRDHDIYLVSRLDAFTMAETLALVDKAAAPAADGRVVLDGMGTRAAAAGEAWLAAASSRLAQQGHSARVLLETTPEPARAINPVLGYYGWGSTDPQNRVRKVGMGFVPGAIAATFMSSDARTFREPPGDWQPGADSPNPSGRFAGSAHSLAGDLIREGVTGLAAHVGEPYLQSVIRPDILFPAYLSGSNLIEAFYSAMPHLSWQTVIIGDPLCAPFKAQAGRAASDIGEGFDRDTTLPLLFSLRRVAQMIQSFKGLPLEALIQAVRAEALLARGEEADAVAALERASTLAPRVASWQLQLGAQYDAAGRFDDAISRYEAVVEIEPRNFAALNNLAYALAVRRKVPAEALPLAKRAAEVAPDNPAVLDTLGWTEHLLGNGDRAVELLARAVRVAPANAAMRLHAAEAYAAIRRRDMAERELAEALRLEPELESDEAVGQIRSRLKELAGVSQP